MCAEANLGELRAIEIDRLAAVSGGEDAEQASGDQPQSSWLSTAERYVSAGVQGMQYLPGPQGFALGAGLQGFKDFWLGSAR